MPRGKVANQGGVDGSLLLCRFSDACMRTQSAGADGRRRKTRHETREGSAGGAVGYGDLSVDGIIGMVDWRQLNPERVQGWH